MGIPKVNQCCCGCTLQTGCKIIGYLGAISGIILIILFAFGVAAVSGDTQPEHKDAVLVIRIIICFAIALCLVSVVFSVLLIVGASKGKPGCLTAWIIYAFISLAVSTLLYLSQMVEQFKVGQNEKGASSLFSMIFSIVLTSYFIIVVSSYKKELQGRR